MFIRDDSLKRLDIDVADVVQLWRSANPVQVALEGHTGQRAGAYLCFFRIEQALKAFFALELYDSRCLVFFAPEQADCIHETQMKDVVDEGLFFAESMGFLMTDLEIQTLGRQEQEQLWMQLSLKTGVPQPPAIFAAGHGGLSQSAARRDTVRGRAGQKMSHNEEYEARRRRLIDNAGRILAAF